VIMFIINMVAIAVKIIAFGGIISLDMT